MAKDGKASLEVHADLEETVHENRLCQLMTLPDKLPSFAQGLYKEDKILGIHFPGSTGGIKNWLKDTCAMRTSSPPSADHCVHVQLLHLICASAATHQPHVIGRKLPTESVPSNGLRDLRECIP